LTPHPDITDQTPFQIVFTSGTTSEPRGIVHTHRNVLVTLAPIEREMAKYRRYARLVHPLRFLHSLPLSHVFGQFMGLWIPCLLAAEVHFAQQLEPARVTALIRRERISVLVAVPRIQQLLRAHLLSRFPTLEAELAASTGISIYKRWWHFRRVHSALGWKFWAVISGGATLPPELESFWNRLGFALIQGYGMTETSALVTLNHPFRIKQGTIGRPLPGREVRIADDGEVLVRGEMLAASTWTAGGLRPRESEWLATGDLAARNPEGDLRFLGRKSDVIVTAAGLNIHPADLEAALTAQPGLRDAAIVPVELSTGTEPVAVLLSSLAGPDLQTAIAEANRTLADFQQVRRTLLWPQLELPYTSTGKLIRRQVADWAAGQLLQRPAAATPPTGDTLLTLIASLTHEAIPATRDPGQLRLSEDLHLDSLGRVQLQSALEQHYGLELDDDALASATTLADLRTLLEPRNTPGAPGLASENRESSPEPQASTKTPQLRTDNSELTPHLYPRWPWTAPIHALRVAFLELILRPLVWLLANPRVRYAPGALAVLTGQRATDNGQPPFLLIANHVTAYDAALILYALPTHLRRRVAAAMSGEMLLDLRLGRNQANHLVDLVAPIGYLLVTALFNVFPLPRARGFRASFAHAGQALDRRYSVLIFPEGTRSRTGRTNPFRPGIGLLAQQSQVPVLPIALVGLNELVAARSTDAKRARSWFRPGTLEVRIGAPIPAPSDPADPATIAATLESALTALLTPGSYI
jgi:long-chain acyl-CoA synthetase